MNRLSSVSSSWVISGEESGVIVRLGVCVLVRFLFGEMDVGADGAEVDLEEGEGVLSSSSVLKSSKVDLIRVVISS